MSTINGPGNWYKKIKPMAHFFCYSIKRMFAHVQEGRAPFLNYYKRSWGKKWWSLKWWSNFMVLNRKVYVKQTESGKILIEY